MKSPCSQIRLAHTNSSTRTFYTQAANPQESQLQRTYLHFLLEAKLWHFRSFESKCILFFKSFGKTQQSFLSLKKEVVFSVAIRHFLFFLNKICQGYQDLPLSHFTLEFASTGEGPFIFKNQHDYVREESFPPKHVDLIALLRNS